MIATTKSTKVEQGFGAYTPARPGTPKFTTTSVHAPGRLDLRSTRDLSSRRLWSTRLRGLSRVITLVVGDSVVALAALLVVTWVTQANVGPHWAHFYPRILVFLLFAQAAVGTYNKGCAHPDVARVTVAVFAAQAARFGLDLMYGAATSLTPGGLLVLTVALAVMLSTWRLALSRALRVAYSFGIGVTRTLVVADQFKAADILERLETANERRVVLAGHVVPDAAADPTAIGGIEDIPNIIEELDIRNVVISAHLEPDVFHGVIRACFMHGTSVSVIPSELTQIPCRVSARDLFGWPLIELEAARLHLAQVAAKRIAEAVLALVLFVVLLPVLAIIALLVSAESTGPILFSQQRPGLGGRRFSMLKFRTMRADAEQVLRADPELYAKFLANDCKLPASEDPRISRVGRFLRASSLDELPQLINVIRGDMSLVGPRPMVGPELEHYGEWAPVVLGVRPGMTGYWQVAGRSKIAYPERAQLDIHYVTNWSIWMDLQIMARTFPAVVRRHGAH